MHHSDIGELIKGSTLENILEQEKHLASQFKNTGQFKFTLIEEKGKSYGGRSLEFFEPQVVGEALAMCVTLLTTCHMNVHNSFDSLKKTKYHIQTHGIWPKLTFTLQA